MRVYKMSQGDAFVYVADSNPFDILSALSIGEKMTVECLEMTPEEFEAIGDL